MSLSPTLIWFLVGLALVLVEFMAPGVILVFFGLGAWLVALTTTLGLTGTLGSQLLVFAITSLVLLFSLRKWVKTRFLGHISSEQDPVTNLDEFTGTRVLVARDIVPGSVEGRVEFKGADWSAVSEVAISKGQMAEIVAVEGITLKVKPCNGKGES
jgi:membrane protein implicated in regulation of membrane protease activity